LKSLGKNSDDDSKLQMQAHFARNDLNLKEGQVAIVVNGFVYGPLDEDESFEVEDFLLLERFFERRGAKMLAQQVDEWGVSNGDGKSSDVVLRSVAVIGKYATKKRRTFLELESSDSERSRA
jgi:Thioredoxin-like domain